jgi:hypothetical protein
MNQIGLDSESEAVRVLSNLILAAAKAHSPKVAGALVRRAIIEAADDINAPRGTERTDFLLALSKSTIAREYKGEYDSEEE